VSRTVRVVLSILISAVLFWLALRNVDWDRSIAAMRSASYFWVLLMLPMTIWTLYIRAQRWRVFLGGVGTAPMSSLVAATNIGFMANMVLPLRVGEVIRPVLLSRKEGLPLSGVLGSCLLERIFDMFCILVLFGIAASWVQVSDEVQQWGYALLTIALTVGAALALLRFQESLALRIASAACGILPQAVGEPLYKFVEGFVRALAMLDSPAAFARAFGWSFFLWAVIGSMYILGFWAFHLDVPNIKGGLVLTAIIAIAVSVPSAPGFIGSYQLGCRLALGVFGIDESTALAYSLVLHMTQFVSVIGAGFYSLWREGMTFRDVEAREAEGEEALAAAREGGLEATDRGPGEPS
jgi:glycosyltransferase 2 family protein